MSDRYITVKEVAKRLQVCKASIYAWAKRDLFPQPMKFGSSSRWSLLEVEEWEKSRNDKKDGYLTGKEVIERLQVCKTSIYIWAKKGLFPQPIKVDNLLYWTEQEIDEWVKSRPKGAYGEKG